MPGTLCHLAFAEQVYQMLSSSMPIDKIKFISGNLIPDLAAVDKNISHYRKSTTIPELLVPDMKRVGEEVFALSDPIKLGIYCHLYLDYYFIEEFLIPEFVWDRPRMKIVNPRNKMEWDPEPFFAQNGVYYDAFNEINSLLIKDGYISMQTLIELPDELHKSGIDIFDKRREKTWRSELEEYIVTKKEYTGNVFDYEHLMSFMDRKTIQLTAEILKTEYGK